MFNKAANMSKLMKQAQKMKDNMDKAQNELKDMRIEVDSNDKMLKIVLDGNKNMISFNINEDLLSEDKDFIEDVFISAFNKANKEADIKIKEKMAEATGGMMPNLPGF
tara:strand:- start:729 stop:1052 length:324 start_codon:yes stop_codon:yes gene_type:complete